MDERTKGIEEGDCCNFITRKQEVNQAIPQIKIMTSKKFDLDKFNGENDFNLWRIKMKALMVHEGISAAISMDEMFAIEDKKLQIKIQSKAHSALILSLGDEVLREVSEETTTM